jgi:hypothetical protein
MSDSSSNGNLHEDGLEAGEEIIEEIIEIEEDSAANGICSDDELRTNTAY